jgi:hypothetical protein
MRPQLHLASPSGIAELNSLKHVFSRVAAINFDKCFFQQKISLLLKSSRRATRSVPTRWSGPLW